MNPILFFANYPTDTNIQDGMLQRIKAVDIEFLNFKRVYVDVSIVHYFRKKHFVDESGLLEVYHLNLFVHLLFIYRLVAIFKNIYIHSLYNYYKLYFLSFASKNITLDIHGVVPEELEYSGYRLKSFLLGIAEKRLFTLCSSFVYVSNEMRKYYINKYPFIESKVNILKPIFPTNVLRETIESETNSLKKELGISETDTVFIYSGNTQKWQNVDLVIENMYSIAQRDYFFIFLTGDLDIMEDKIKSYKSDKSVRYIVRKVSPDVLCNYYEISHYGYILRENHVLNRVAAPTKLIEYLYYGLTPIVKYEIVGDAYDMGYSYLLYNCIEGKLLPNKSKENKLIALKLAGRCNDIKLTALYSESQLEQDVAC